ncbi:MAG TPA: redoxin domain-containing protein [Pirellulaceae bacterium]|nr:redoxin domain-containing protein [Pirellulaceae bacterium]
MTTLIVAAIFPWLLIAVGAWLGHQLVRQNGRILLRLEAIEKQLGRRSGARQGAAAHRPEGLLIGEAAPDFELPDLAGVRRKLSEFRGKDLLLIFFNPKCGFCTKMAGDLAALPPHGGDGWATPVVITTGDANENRKLVERFGIRCIVLVQNEMEVASQFRAQGTPMGYRIDAAGRIASELAVGAESLLKLADLKAAAVGRGSPDPAHAIDRRSRGRSQEGDQRSGMSARSETFAEHGSAHKNKQPDPSLARSKLNRTGLKGGTIAPDFSLPCLGGGELTLADFRGRRVLLVFSDPNCGPCDELAPLLQEMHVERPDLQVLVISRRDAEATRAKADALELSFPIVMQQQWEISKKYGMFATPIGYLIDEQGIVAKDVAVGVTPILALADHPKSAAAEVEPSANGKEAAWAT